jgi:hypothetical protein
MRAARIAISPIKIISRVDEEILTYCLSHTSNLRHLSSLINVREEKKMSLKILIYMYYLESKLVIFWLALD